LGTSAALSAIARPRMGAGSSSQKPLTAMARPHPFEKASPTAMDVAAGLEHFILADGFGNHVYRESRPRRKRLPL
jgi:hypothetical protein